MYWYRAFCYISGLCFLPTSLHYLYSVFILWNRRNACTSKPA